MNPFSRISDAEKLSVDQLKTAMQDKSLPAYIAIPLIEEKMDMQDRAKNMMAMQQPQQPPIAEEIMQRTSEQGGIDSLPTNLASATPVGMGGSYGMGAAPTSVGSGIEGLPSNLPGPATMAGGGIVALAGGGDLPYGPPTLEDLRRQQRQNYYTEEQLAGNPELQAVLGAQPAQPYYIDPELQSVLGREPTVQPLPTQGFQLRNYPQTKEEEPIHAKVEKLADKKQAPPPSDDDLSELMNSYGVGRKPRSATEMVKGILGGEEGYIKQSEENQKRLFDEMDKNRLEGKAFHEYESMLRKEAEEAGVDKEKAKSMAIFKAGLAIMGGTSPNALVNIAKGAEVGATDYQQAYEKLRHADRQRIKEFALIEEARRAEEKGEVERRDAKLLKAFEIGQKRIDTVANASIQAGMADVNNAHEFARTILQGGFTLKAAQMRTAARSAGGADTKDLTKYVTKLKEEIPFEESFLPIYKKQNNLPNFKLGVNPQDDARAQEAYKNFLANKVAQHFNILGGVQASLLGQQPTAETYPGFSLEEKQ